MMQLYTTLVKIKQELATGGCVPFVPLTAAALEVIDPEFQGVGPAGGMGVIYEDEEFGLRCPIRECGKFVHRLSHHANYSHKPIGGAVGLREILSIGPTVSLLSGRFKYRVGRSIRQAQLRNGTTPNPAVALAASLRPDVVRRRGLSRRKTYDYVGGENTIIRCKEQVLHQFIDLANALGRRPSLGDARAAGKRALESAAKKLYGSWNALVERAGFDPHVRSPRSVERWTIDAVLEAIRGFQRAHGRTPRYRDAERIGIPVLPNPRIAMRVTGSRSWDDVLKLAAA